MISCIINPFVVHTNDEAGNASQMYAYVNIGGIECLKIEMSIVKMPIWIFDCYIEYIIPEIYYYL